MTPLEMPPGSASPKAQKSETATRIASALVLGALALAAVIVRPWTFAALVIVAGIAVAWEWGRLVRGASFDAIALI
ncbi:MAG: hypothetical protein WBB88_06385, partial [Methyloceanibacter sp.]